MGLSNVIIMLPFVRTPQERKNTIEIMEKRGVNALQVYVMCEIPANVIIADEFLKAFYGYGTDSNNLTQLTLGVDYGSGIISHLFDEHNETTKRMIKIAIDT